MYKLMNSISLRSLLAGCLFFMPTALLVNVAEVRAAEVCVTGAGDSEWNGTYSDNADPGIFRLDGTHVLFKSMASTFWEFAEDVSALSPAYTAPGSGGESSPVGLSYVQVLASAPAPSVASGSCATPTPTIIPTPTVTPTPVAPTPTPVPTATTPPGEKITIPAMLCVAQVRGEDYKDWGGVYVLEVPASNTVRVGEVYIYSTSDDSHYLGGVYSDGTYSGVIRELHNSTEEFRARAGSSIGDVYKLQADRKDTADYKKPPRTALLEVTEGPCTDTPEQIPSSSITGSVSNSGSGNSLSAEAADSGSIYALLFDGLVANETSRKAPLGGTIVGGDGSYAFDDVLPGEYTVCLYADGRRFSPACVEVAAISETPAVAPMVDAQVITVNDAGCTRKDLTELIFNANVAMQSLREKVVEQTAYNEQQAYDLIKKNGKQLVKTARTLASARNKIEAVYQESVKVVQALPLASRSGCPAINSCTTQSLGASKRQLNKQINRLIKIAEQVREATLQRINRPAVVRKNERFIKQINKLANAGRKKIKAIPSKNQVCPEV